MRSVVVLAALLVATPAFAEDSDPVDPAAKRAGEEANLESQERRQGFWLQSSLGASVTIGGGTGNGGAVSLKVGQVVRPNAVVLLEGNYNGQGHEIGKTLYINDYTTILAGMQIWPGQSVYFRVAGGFGAYRCKQCQDPDDAMNIEPVDYRRRGITGTFAVGLELVRFKGIVLGLDASSVTSITPDGVITSLGLQWFLSVD